MWGDPYKGQLGLYIDEKGWTHEEKSLYPIPLELNLDFLKHPPTKAPAKLGSEDEEGKLDYEPDLPLKIECGGVNSALLT